MGSRPWGQWTWNADKLRPVASLSQKGAVGASTPRVKTAVGRWDTPHVLWSQCSIRTFRLYEGKATPSGLRGETGRQIWYDCKHIFKSGQTSAGGLQYGTSGRHYLANSIAKKKSEVSATFAQQQRPMLLLTVPAAH